jgi:hypothetical protein
MDLIKLGSGGLLGEGDIKAPTVVGNDDFKPLNILDKIIQVLTVGIGMDRMTII